MGALHVIGEAPLVGGFALVGAVVQAEAEPDRVRAAWRALPADAAVVVLTPAAARALGDAPDQPGAPLVVVLP